MYRVGANKYLGLGDKRKMRAMYVCEVGGIIYVLHDTTAILHETTAITMNFLIHPMWDNPNCAQQHNQDVVANASLKHEGIQH